MTGWEWHAALGGMVAVGPVKQSERPLGPATLLRRCGAGVPAEVAGRARELADGTRGSRGARKRCSGRTGHLRRCPLVGDAAQDVLTSVVYSVGPWNRHSLPA